MVLAPIILVACPGTKGGRVRWVGFRVEVVAHRMVLDVLFVKLHQPLPLGGSRQVVLGEFDSEDGAGRLMTPRLFSSNYNPLVDGFGYAEMVIHFTRNIHSGVDGRGRHLFAHTGGRVWVSVAVWLWLQVD